MICFTSDSDEDDDDDDNVDDDMVVPSLFWCSLRRPMFRLYVCGESKRGFY